MCFEILFSMTMLLAGANAISVEGETFEPEMARGGAMLKLIGAGLREKWFFDVYALGAYSESGSCKSSELVKNEETKLLRLVMLRTVSADKMASTLSEAFDAHMPKTASQKLKAQRKQFESYFKDELKEGQVLDFLYIPKKGTTIAQNKKALGPVLGGSDFHQVLWDIYFGDTTCCEDLKAEVLKNCLPE